MKVVFIEMLRGKSAFLFFKLNSVTNYLLEMKIYTLTNINVEKISSWPSWKLLWTTSWTTAFQKWGRETYKCGLTSPLRELCSHPTSQEHWTEIIFLLPLCINHSAAMNIYETQYIHIYIYKIGISFFQMCTQINPYGTPMSCYLLFRCIKRCRN